MAEVLPIPPPQITPADQGASPGAAAELQAPAQAGGLSFAALLGGRGQGGQTAPAVDDDQSPPAAAGNLLPPDAPAVADPAAVLALLLPGSASRQVAAPSAARSVAESVVPFTGGPRLPGVPGLVSAATPKTQPAVSLIVPEAAGLQPAVDELAPVLPGGAIPTPLSEGALRSLGTLMGGAEGEGEASAGGWGNLPTLPSGAPGAAADLAGPQSSSSVVSTVTLPPVVRSETPVSQQAVVQVPVHQPGWDQAVGERVAWHASQNIQGVQLQLNPPELGPLEVRISMQHDQASVAFASQHAAVRDALDGALPRLREAFAQQGLNLVDVNVGQHSFSDQRQPGGAAPGDQGWSDHDAGYQGPVSAELGQISGRAAAGLLDIYA